MKRKRVLFPDELKHFDPKEGAVAEVEVEVEAGEENGGEETGEEDAEDDE
ncbi:MAG: hypothetical protein KF862_07360 [Chitinophagaceae bacterium]|nr:hypothetical protein [Chitinophagaceae bacterium]